MLQCSADNLPAKTDLRWKNKHLMLLMYWQTAVELPQTDHLLFQSFFLPILLFCLFLSLFIAHCMASACCLFSAQTLLPSGFLSLTSIQSLLYYRVSFFHHFFSFYFSTEVMFLCFLCCLCASCFLCAR